MNVIDDFICYFESKQYLDIRLEGTTLDELALWVSIGAENGGLNAYSIDELYANSPTTLYPQVCLV